MTDKKSSESRRKLLKAIGASSGAIVAGKSLPESWSRPVVDSVLLPAHAQTSMIPPPTQLYKITDCTGESRNGAPAGQLFQTGAEVIENLTATVTPAPPVGTVIRRMIIVSPVNLNYSDRTSPTDSGGLADQFNPVGLPNAEPVPIGSVFTLRYEFDDPATFGDSFCEVQLTVIATPD